VGRSTVQELDTATPQLSPLVGGQVDGPKLGIPRQGGDARFLQRFALQTHDGYDAASAMRFALEHQNPLVAVPVTGGPDYPEEAFSAVSCSDPNVLLWTLKPSEDGIAQGVMARVWNLSASPAKFTITTWRPLSRAERTTHVETNLERAAVKNGALAGTARPHQLQTYRLFLSRQNP